MPIGEAFEINPKVSIKRGTEVPFISMDRLEPGCRDVDAVETRSYSSGSKFEPGDTLMARITPCLENGKIARYLPKDAPLPAAGSTEFMVLRGRPGITKTEFAYYFAIDPTIHDLAVSLMTGTSGRQRVDARAFSEAEVRIPSLEIQHAICSVLGSLDDKIAANLAVVQHANVLATSFVAARHGESSRVSLKALTTLISRGITPRYDDAGGYVVLNQRCIRDSRVNVAPSRTVKSLPKNREKVLRKDDVLVNSTGQGTLGRVARWISTAPDTSVDTHVSIVRFNSDLADPAFAGTVLSTMQRQVEDLAEGSTGQTELKRDLLGGLELNLPPLEKQREVGQQLRILDDLSRACLEENQALTKTRDELLPLLMSGKITVKEASQEAAAARAQISSKENEV